jgi:hypothetical protein
LFLDAENGRKLTIRRLRAARVGDLDVQPVNAGGLRTITDIGSFKRTIEQHKANLVVFDSLRGLVVWGEGERRRRDGANITALRQFARGWLASRSRR